MNLSKLCGQKPAFPRGVPADQLACHFADGHAGDHSWARITRAQPIFPRMPTEAESEMQHLMSEARKLK